LRKKPNFLLAVPAYRESSRLGQFLPGLLQVISTEFPGSLVMLVDDGSGPGEITALKALLKKMRTRYRSNFDFLALPKNRGKGGAILAAWKSCRSRFDYLGFVDADGALKPVEVARLAEELSPGGRGPAVFASRIKMLGFSVERGLIRHYAGRIFATWVGICLESRIYDSQCGLKFIPTHIFKRISSQLDGHGFAWDIELLAKLLAAGCPIREIPVNWSDIKGSKVRLLRDGLNLFSVALREGWMKKYNQSRVRLEKT
jgi:dolichyl-phosphate beta-glucosyltransferase